MVALKQQNQNPYVFIAQMQLTRSKLKYIYILNRDHDKSRCSTGPRMDRLLFDVLPCLCIHCGWHTQYLFLTSSSVVGEPTDDTLRRLDCTLCAKHFFFSSFFIASMLHALWWCDDTFRYAHLKIYVHAGMLSTKSCFQYYISQSYNFFFFCCSHLCSCAVCLRDLLGFGCRCVFYRWERSTYHFHHIERNRKPERPCTSNAKPQRKPT